MATPDTWSEWLAGLWNTLFPPDPGSKAARLEEKRLDGLLAREKAKPPGQRDEERIHRLRVELLRLRLWNMQVRRRCRRAV